MEDVSFTVEAIDNPLLILRFLRAINRERERRVEKKFACLSIYAKYPLHVDLFCADENRVNKVYRSRTRDETLESRRNEVWKSLLYRKISWIEKLPKITIRNCYLSAPTETVTKSRNRVITVIYTQYNTTYINNYSYIM